MESAAAQTGSSSLPSSDGAPTAGVRRKALKPRVPPPGGVWAESAAVRTSAPSIAASLRKFVCRGVRAVRSRPPYGPAGRKVSYGSARLPGDELHVAGEGVDGHVGVARAQDDPGLAARLAGDAGAGVVGLDVAAEGAHLHLRAGAGG